MNEIPFLGFPVSMWYRLLDRDEVEALLCGNASREVWDKARGIYCDLVYRGYSDKGMTRGGAGDAIFK